MLPIVSRNHSAVTGSLKTMKCPNDNATLVMSERNGIEIDYCPECRGVWLDRGELDKIIDRAGAGAPAAAAAAPAAAAPPYQAPPQQQGYQQQYDNRGGYDSRGGYNQPYQKKRKENWLSELFD
jgi:Zn-finger nucleic acid-binding protein